MAQLATILPGARRFSSRNVNATFVGQVMASSGEILHVVLKDITQTELAYELLVSDFGKALGLPIPESYLALDIDDVTSAQFAPKLLNERGQSRSLLFASEIVGKPPTDQFATPGSRTHWEGELCLWARIPECYAFDTLVANVDRHSGNFVCAGDGEFWLIDHGLCFGGHEATMETLSPDEAYNNRMNEWCVHRLRPANKAKIDTSAQNQSMKALSLDLISLLNNSSFVHLLGLDARDKMLGYLTSRSRQLRALTAASLGAPYLL
jgi:hypothetical protein